MTRIAVSLSCAVLSMGLAACNLPTRVGTQNLSSHVTAIQTHQILENLVRFTEDPFSIPSQLQLRNGSQSTTSLVATGVAPSISFTGPLAIPGLSLSGSASGSSQWAVSPVTDVSDLAKLQLIYRLATTPMNNRDFLREYGRIVQAENAGGQVQADGREQIEPPELRLIRGTVGDLPSGPFVQVIGRENQCAAQQVGEGILTSRVCFRAAPGMTAQEVRSRFFLWISAATQAVEPGNGAGAAGGKPAATATAPSIRQRPDTSPTILTPPASFLLR